MLYSNALLPEKNHGFLDDGDQGTEYGAKRKSRETATKVQNCSPSCSCDADRILGSPRPDLWGIGVDAKSRVSKDTYFKILNNFQNAIKSKCPGLLPRKPCLLMMTLNLKPHLIKYLLKDLKWDVLKHSPLSLDFVPSDYHLFPRLKEEFGDQ